MDCWLASSQEVTQKAPSVVAAVGFLIALCCPERYSGFSGKGQGHKAPKSFCPLC